jgi:quinol monooxygenase YgiN
MAIRQIITMRTAHGQRDAFVRGFQPIVERVRNEDGCEQYAIYPSLDDADELIVLERWRDLATLEGVLARHYKGPDDPAVAFLKLLAGAPKRERYEV